MRNVSLILLVHLVTVFGCGTLSLAARTARGAQAAPPVVPPTIGHRHFCGTVKAISKESISIQGINAHIGGVAAVQTERPETTFYGKPLLFVMPNQIIEAWKVVGRPGEYVISGTDGTATIVREQDQPIRTFTFADDLAVGRFAKGLIPSDSYRVQDVKIGDGLDIWYDRIDGVEFCKSIQITRRPGGLVPPSPNGDDQVPGYKYHEWANAHNEWQDHGTPMPDKFLAPWELAKRRERIAPMPREAVPRIPEAKP